MYRYVYRYCLSYTGIVCSCRIVIRAVHRRTRCGVRVVLSSPGGDTGPARPCRRRRPCRPATRRACCASPPTCRSTSTWHCSKWRRATLRGRSSTPASCSRCVRAGRPAGRPQGGGTRTRRGFEGSQSSFVLKVRAGLPAWMLLLLTTGDLPSALAPCARRRRRRRWRLAVTYLPTRERAAAPAREEAAAKLLEARSPSPRPPPLPALRPNRSHCRWSPAT